MIATSPLTRAAEPGERDSMLRALLADRFKFEPSRGPVEVLVVDRIDRPSEN